MAESGLVASQSVITMAEGDLVASQSVITTAEGDVVECEEVDMSTVVRVCSEKASFIANLL